MKPINVSNTTLSFNRKKIKFDAKQAKRHDFGDTYCVVCDKVFTKYHSQSIVCDSSECVRLRRNHRSKTYHDKNREKIKAKAQAYYKANREKFSARRKAYTEENREKINAQARAYRKANREKISARRKAQYHAKKDASK